MGTIGILAGVIEYTRPAVIALEPAIDIHVSGFIKATQGRGCREAVIHIRQGKRGLIMYEICGIFLLHLGGASPLLLRRPDAVGILASACSTTTAAERAARAAIPAG